MRPCLPIAVVAVGALLALNGAVATIAGGPRELWIPVIAGAAAVLLGIGVIVCRCEHVDRRVTLRVERALGDQDISDIATFDLVTYMAVGRESEFARSYFSTRDYGWTMNEMEARMVRQRVMRAFPDAVVQITRLVAA